MRTTRREFMRNVGIALAAIAATRCTSCQPACYTPASPLPPTPRPGAGGAWDRLRELWDSLDLLAQAAPDLERGEAIRDRLIANHLTTLDSLIAMGELEHAVADDMRVAFESAVYHVWQANAPITCYEPSLYPNYQIESSSDLAQQADALEEMAAASDIDPATVAQVQAAIERDVAFLSMTTDEQQALVSAIVRAAGDSRDYPTLAELDLDAPPDCVAAAQELVDVLLGRK